MIKKWLPLLDRVIVKQDAAPFLFPSGTPGQEGLAIPDDQREKFRPHTGEVVAVGPGQWVNGVFCPVALSKGQHVMFAHPDTLTKIEHDGAEHLMMRETDVFLVLNEPETKLAQRKATQVFIKEPYHIEGNPEILVDYVQNPQDTYNPLKNDRFQTYDGLFCRAIAKDGSRLQLSLVPEQAGGKQQLFFALLHHAKHSVPLVFVGPKL